MNMVDAVKSVLTQYFGFSGRARRSEYWFWILATFLVAIVIALIELALGLSSDGGGPISTIFSLATFFPGLAVTFRRLHDTGRSGWWIGGFYLAAIFFLLLIVFAAFGATTSSGDSTLLAGIGIISIVFIIGVLVYCVVLLVFLCQDSVTGPNKYGPNPKNAGNYDIFE